MFERHDPADEDTEDESEPRLMLDNLLTWMSGRGEVIKLAADYKKAKDPKLKARIERALNEGIPSHRVTHGPDGTMHDEAASLVGMDGLPESTMALLAGFLDNFASIFELRNKTGSEIVRDACDNALINMFGVFERSALRGDIAAAFNLARAGREEPLSAKVSEARDSMLASIISKWCAEAKDDNILKLSGVEGISSAVKDAAAAALSWLGNIPDMHFKEAISVLAICGKLDALSDAYTKAVLPRTKEQIGSVMDLAMQVAASLGWGDDGYNGHMVSCPRWYGRGPFKQLLTTDCPEPLKQKARKILEEGGSYGDPLGLGKKASENLDMADSCLRMVKLYLLQERQRNRDQILEGATVEPPARGTSSPAGRRIPHGRIR